MDKNLSLWAPIGYKAAPVPKGKRNPVDGWFRTDLPISIPIMSEEECPVAISIGHAPGYPLGAYVGGRKVDLRAMGGVFYRPLLSPAGWPVTAVNLQKLLSGGDDPQAFVQWKDFPFPRKINDKSGIFDPTLPAFENPFLLENLDVFEGRIELSKREEAEIEARRTASEMIIVADEVYIKTEEPKWVLKTSNAGILITLSLCGNEAGTGISRSVSFRIDRGAEVFELASLLHHAPPEVYAELEDVKVFAPDQLRADDVGSAGQKIFGQLQEYLGSDLGRYKNIGAVRNWCDLVEAGHRFAEGDNSAVHDGFAALRRMNDCGLQVNDEGEWWPSRVQDAVNLHLVAYEHFLSPTNSSDMDFLALDP